MRSNSLKLISLLSSFVSYFVNCKRLITEKKLNLFWNHNLQFKNIKLHQNKKKRLK